MARVSGKRRTRDVIAKPAVPGVPEAYNASEVDRAIDAVASATERVIDKLEPHIGAGGTAHAVATTAAAGFMPTLSGSAADLLTGAGTWVPATHVEFIEVDFGAAPTDVATLVVAATWPTATSAIIVVPQGDTVDHDCKTTLSDGVVAACASISAGVGFTVTAHAAAATTGLYAFVAIGVA